MLALRLFVAALGIVLAACSSPPPGAPPAASWREPGTGGSGGHGGRGGTGAADCTAEPLGTPAPVGMDQRPASLAPDSTRSVRSANTVALVGSGDAAKVRIRPGFSSTYQRLASRGAWSSSSG